MADWSDLFDDEAPVPRLASTDAGPEARRAAAGLPPGPRMTDPSPFPAVKGFVLPAGERIDPTTRQRYPVPMFPGASDPGGQPEVWTNNPEEAGDNLVQTGLLGAGAGRVAGGLVGKVAPRAVPVAEGVVGGGVGSKTAGGDFSTGALAGGGLAGLSAALSGVGRAVTRIGPRRDAGIQRDLGMHGTEQQKSDLVRLGAKKVADTARDFGVVGAPDAQTAHASAMAKLNAVGDDIGQVYNTLGTQYARPLGALMVTTEGVRQRLAGTRAGQAIADAVHEEMTNLFNVHGGSKDALVPLGVLRQELTDSQRLGYSGRKFGKLNPSMQAEAQREIADALHHELDIGLAGAAKDPRFAPLVDRIDQLNATYHAGKVVTDVTARMAQKATFRREPTAKQLLKNKLSGGFIDLPASTTPILPPTGRSMARIPGRPAEPVSPLPPGIAGALSARDPDAAATELSKELFGRPTIGLAPAGAPQ